jgi:hypothetical protein
MAYTSDANSDLQFIGGYTSSNNSDLQFGIAEGIDFEVLCNYTGPVGEVNFTVPDDLCSGDLKINIRTGQSLLSFVLESDTAAELETDNYTGETLAAVLQISALFDLIHYTGEYSDADLSIQVNLYPDSFTGEYGDADLSVFPGAELETDNYTGETLAAILQANVRFDADSYTGETLDIDIEFHPQSFLETDNYTGETLDADIQTSVTFSSDNYTGESGDADLTIFPSAGLGEFLSYSGEYGNADLSIQVNLDAGAYTGQYSNADLSVFPGAELDIDAYTGETADVSLRTDDALDGICYTGEYSDCDLSNFPGATLETDNYTGETLSDLELSTTHTLIPRVYVGQYANADLTIFPSPGIEDVVSYSGELAEVDLFFDFGLEPLDGYTGEYVEVDTLEEEPFIYIYSGESGAFELSTTHNLPSNAYTGQTANAILTLPPRAELSPIAYTGQFVYAPLEALRTPYLNVIFWGSIWTHFDYRSQTYFDLSTDDACCQQPRPTGGVQFYFELMKEGIPETEAGGSGQFFFAELSTQARLEADAYTGELGSLVETVDYFEVTFETGTHSNSFAFDADLRHRLCKGHFIPNGYWMVVELNDVLNEDCYADRMYAGETFQAKLSFDHNFVVYTYTGSYMRVDVEVDALWRAEAGHGSRMLFDFQVESDAYSGEYMSLAFFDPSYDAGAGEYVETTLTIEYYTRFTEDGCLDNEFVWQNESGDEIPEMFRDLPIEGDPYTHSIDGECY